MELDLLHMTNEHVNDWYELPEKGVDGLPMVYDAYGGPGGEIVYFLMKANICLGVPARWATRYFIVDKTNQCVVGIVGFRNGPVNGRLEVGYSVAPSYEGKGVATWAVKELVKRSLNTDPEYTIFARTVPTNIASQKVLLKSGFEPIGLVMSELGYEIPHFELTSVK